MLLNPYIVTNFTDGYGGTHGNLEKSDGTRARFFVEVAYHDVWAWDVLTRHRFIKRATTPEDGDYSMWFWGGKMKADRSIDFQARFNFIAKDDKETTAAAVVGTGEFGGEVTLGLPVWRKLTVNTPNSLDDAGTDLNKTYEETRSARWVGVIVSYSGVTDSDAFDIHSRVLSGIGFRVARKDWSLQDAREFTLSVNAGVAFLDTAEFISSNSHEIRLRHRDVIDYKVDTAFGLEAELNLPLTGHISATLGTRLYAGMDPNVWNAYIAVTVDNVSDLLGLGKKK